MVPRLTYSRRRGQDQRQHLASGEISISVGAEPDHVQAGNLKKNGGRQEQLTSTWRSSGAHALAAVHGALIAVPPAMDQPRAHILLRPLLLACQSHTPRLLHLVGLVASVHSSRTRSLNIASLARLAGLVFPIALPRAGVIGAMRRAPERGALLLLLLALAAPRLVGADTNAADGTFLPSCSPRLASSLFVRFAPEFHKEQRVRPAAPIVRRFELHEFGFCRLCGAALLCWGAAVPVAFRFVVASL
jgi:hypothetical protein